LFSIGLFHIFYSVVGTTVGTTTSKARIINMSCAVESADAGYWLLAWSGVILTSALIIATGLSGTPLDQLGTFYRLASMLHFDRKRMNRF
jgi:hypothetical protein